ncbi:MAG TPA: hypothetical protein VIF37_19865 [Methylobacter sp.]|jgi:hypothetical protein
MSQEKPNTYIAEFRASAVKLANESVNQHPIFSSFSIGITSH